MYYKIIDDRQVFSTCKVIQLDGLWISNPSAEQIAAAGWLEYIPPVVPPTPATEPGIDEMVQAVKRMLANDTDSLSDEDALDVAALFPTWASKEGKTVTVGERLWYDGKLYKVIREHVVQSDWTPDTAVSLFVEVSVAEIPDWVQPKGAQDAYAKGDKVKHIGKVWESLVDANVWEPGAAGTEALWKEI